MRARHRHFNPRDAGANTALDGRFTSFSNNASVDTWTSRTGNNSVTQATAANRPTFISSGRASQGVVRFDGLNSPNQDWLQNTNFVVNQPFYVFSSMIFNGKAGAFVCDATSGNRVAMGLNASGNIQDNGKPYIWANIGSGYPEENTDIRGSWNILCGLFNGSSSFLYRNGLQVGAGNTGPNNFATLKIGERIVNSSNVTQLDGDIGNFFVLPGTNQSIRKRCEHAAAYSFKITCS